MTTLPPGPESSDRRRLLGAGLLGGAALVGATASRADASSVDAGFYSFGPERVADTRNGTRLPKGRLSAGQTRTVSLSSFFTPGFDLTVVLTVSVATTEGRGALVLWENGRSLPEVFTTTWAGKGQASSTLAMVGLRSSDVTFQVHCSGRGARTHLIVDVVGYYFRDTARQARPPVERR